MTPNTAGTRCPYCLTDECRCDADQAAEDEAMDKLRFPKDWPGPDTREEDNAARGEE